MSEAHADVSKHVRIYMFVFAALIAGTTLTVLVSMHHFGGVTNIVLAVLIAAAKGSLVAAVFMHLKWERSVSIWWLLILCGVLFIVLMLLPSLTMKDQPPGVRHSSWDVLPTPAVTGEHAAHD